MRTIRRVCAWLLAALGAVHVLYNAVEHRELSPDAVWFAGAGLALLFLGLLNLADLAADHASARAICRAANVLARGSASWPPSPSPCRRRSSAWR